MDNNVRSIRRRATWNVITCPIAGGYPLSGRPMGVPMYKNTTIGVVVPAYNEEGFVGEVIETIPSYVDRIYAIDDASSDGTWQEMRTAASRENDGSRDRRAFTSGRRAVFEEPVVTLRNDENRGVGGSIKRGYARALEDGVDVVAVMNGDGQMDPTKLDWIIDPVVKGRTEFAKGNRLLARELRDGMSTWRLFGNGILTLLTKIASGYWRMMDPQNGYTAISSEALDTIAFEMLYEDYGFCNDLLITLNTHDMRIADVAMPAVYGDESSSIVYSRFVPRLLGLLLRRFLWRLNAKYLLAGPHPLAFLYYLGGVATVAGMSAIVRTVHASRKVSESAIRWIGSALLFLGGLLSLVIAIGLERRTNKHLEMRFDHSHR